MSIEGKFFYDESSDGKPVFKLKKDGSLFIGTYEGTPCAIRCYENAADKIIKECERDLQALQSKGRNIHENFIRYLGHARSKNNL